MTLVDEHEQFHRSMDFEPVAHAELAFPHSTLELPFPLSLMSEEEQHKVCGSWTGLRFAPTIAQVR